MAEVVETSRWNLLILIVWAMVLDVSVVSAAVDTVHMAHGIVPFANYCY